MRVPLIDTHQHLVYPNKFSYPWIENHPELQNAFTLEDYTSQTSDAGIESTLFMEVDVAEEQSAAEAKFFSELADNPDNSLCGVIATARAEKDGFDAYLDKISGPRLKGIRRILHSGDDSLSDSELFRENVRSLSKRELPFDLCIFPRQCAAGFKLVDACPNTQMMLDHCGIPDLASPDAFNDWIQLVRSYAERPHLSAKLSGIVAYAPTKEVTLEMISPYLDAMLETFGPDRLVWGSDWPVCTSTTSLNDWVRLFRQWLESLSEPEQNKVGHINAKRFYKL